MERITNRVAAAAAAVGLALLAAGCSGNAATATGTNTSPVSAASRALPSPFTVTARYTATSLGLTHPDDARGRPGRQSVRHRLRASG